MFPLKTFLGSESCREQQVKDNTDFGNRQMWVAFLLAGKDTCLSTYDS